MTLVASADAVLTVDRAGPGAGAVSADALTRARILDAMVVVVCERGYAGTSIALVCARAGISRRTFDRLFADLPDCLLTVLDEGLERSIALIEEAFAGECCWRDGARLALASLLSFLDAEPDWTRVWLVESLAAGSWALEHRQRNVNRLREAVVSLAVSAGAPVSSSLVSEGVVISVMGLVHARLVERDARPLVELLVALVALVFQPYLDAATAAGEVERARELAGRVHGGRYGRRRVSRVSARTRTLLLHRRWSTD